jgi:hypothetical protein
MAEKGVKRPIFEGNMLPQKIWPQIGANIGDITGILLSKKKSRLLYMGRTSTANKPFAL